MDNTSSLCLRKRVEILFADIDDTMTTHGLVPEETFFALWKARKAGLKIVPVTGRPAGWCDHIARMWPVDGVIGENGAFYFRKTPGHIVRVHSHTPEERTANRGKLDQIKKEVLAEVPGCGIASDQSYREYDLAVDFCEDVPRLGWDDVSKITDVFHRHGATAKVSSIHVNGWFGDFDKLSMTKRYIADTVGPHAADDMERFAFVGDSPNDEPMFSAFPISFGVANIAEFLPKIKHLPARVVSKEGGAGFAEVVDLLIGNS